MSYQSVVFNVLIASPGDVTKERALVREVIHEWNALHSFSTKKVFLPVSWETHSHPSMDDRPQGVINEQIVDKADLVVGIFWTRLGTPTGLATSGTVEELERLVRAGKPAMIYFSSAPVQLDSVDVAQYEQLKAFKAALGQRGLYSTYDSPTEFRDMFSRHLAAKSIDDVHFKVREAMPDVPPHTIPPIITPSRAVPTLDEAATALLVEAAADKTGTILKLNMVGGLTVQTNGKQFVEKSNPRSRAIWEAAVNDLEAKGLIETSSPKKDVYRVTNEGYTHADVLRS